MVLKNLKIHVTMQVIFNLVIRYNKTVFAKYKILMNLYYLINILFKLALSPYFPKPYTVEHQLFALIRVEWV
jgi:hypothetical protein